MNEFHIDNNFFNSNYYLHLRLLLAPSPEMERFTEIFTTPYRFVAVGVNNGQLQLRGNMEPLNPPQDPYFSTARINTGPRHCHAGFVDLSNLPNTERFHHLLTADHCVNAFGFRNLYQTQGPLIMTLVMIFIILFYQRRRPSLFQILWIGALFVAFYFGFLKMAFSPIVLLNEQGYIIGQCDVVEHYYIADIALIACTSNFSLNTKPVKPVANVPRSGNLSIAVSLVGLSVKPEEITHPVNVKVPDASIRNFISSFVAQGSWLLHGAYEAYPSYILSDVSSMSGLSGTLCYANHDYSRCVGVLTTFMVNKTACSRIPEDLTQSFGLQADEDL